MIELLEERTTSYFDKERDADEGEVRIGTGLTLREDLYSLCFLFWFKKEFIFGDQPHEVEKLAEQEKLAKQKAEQVHENNNDQSNVADDDFIRDVRSETIGLEHDINSVTLTEA